MDLLFTLVFQQEGATVSYSMAMQLTAMYTLIGVGMDRKMVGICSTFCSQELKELAAEAVVIEAVNRCFATYLLTDPITKDLNLSHSLNQITSKL